jgi:hypothetical protein
MPGKRIRSAILKTKSELAALLGLSRNTVREMEMAGCPFPAGKSTLDWVLDWLKEHPLFRASPRSEKRKGKPNP